MYLRRSPEKLLQLVEAPGSLAVEDTEQALLESGRFHELAVFYRTKGLLPQALRCWRLCVPRTVHRHLRRADRP